MSALTARPEQIEALARSARPEDRERLLNAVVDLCEANAGERTDASGDLIQSVFMDLVTRAERDIRLRLAERIAPAAWAPPALVQALATDEIEIARPVIANSPVLTDPDLIRILVTATIEHHIEVARRPEIGASVVSAILDGAQPPVMTVLAGNPTAEVGPLAMERMVAASRSIAAMRAPLAHHPKLSTELAGALYSWVGDALRGEIVSRYAVDEPAFKSAVERAVADTGAPAPPWGAVAAAPDRDETDQRLVSKLQAADQLRPGYLLRALREGKLGLFEIALACLAGVRTEDIQAAIHADRPDLLAAACAGVGIDRSVFPTVLALVRALSHGAPRGGPDSLARINAAFAAAARGQALDLFRAETGDLAAV